MQHTSLTADAVIGLIPDEVLDDLAVGSEVDYGVKKLHGKVLFKLFLYTLLSTKRISLRIMEAVYASQKFQQLFSPPTEHIRHSSIGMRLAQVRPEYFQKIFGYLSSHTDVARVSFGDKQILVRKIDSTFVTLSSKLIRYGMSINTGQKNLKFSVELTGGIPVNILLFAKQSAISDSISFPKLLQDKLQKDAVNIAVFDRGGESKQHYVDFTKQGVLFVTRVSKLKPPVVATLPLTNTDTATLRLISENRVQVTHPDTKETIKLRMITGISKQTNQSISFLTNVEFLSAAEVSELYKSRWEIETFFKFAKQELQFSHLLSRNENGVRAVMYLTMICAILLSLYKKANRITGWLVAKIKFLDELETWLMTAWHHALAAVFNSHVAPLDSFSSG